MPELRRLLECWAAPPKAGDPVACIASTFTFNPGFFEEECLARFLGLSSSLVSGATAVESAFYVAEREDALSEVTATVLVESAHAAPSTSHRWDVIAAAPPRGVQHAKAAILIWADVVRLLVSSANLTPRGYRQNIEMGWVFDHSVSGPSTTAAALIREAAEFFDEVLDVATAGSEEAQSPRARARRAVGLALERVPAGAVASLRRGEPRLRLVHTLRRGSLLDQAFAGWRGARPTDLTVVSPYFLGRADSDHPLGLDAARRRLTSRRRARTVIAATTLELAGDQLRVELPDAVRNSSGRGDLQVRRWPRPAAEEHRFLHAKALLFSRSGEEMLIAGSANCTEAGLGIGYARNIELAVAVGVRGNRRTGLATALPRLESLPAAHQTWEVPAHEEDEDRDDGQRLPGKFVEALFDPEEGGGVRVLLRPGDQPSTWQILGDGTVWFQSPGDERAELRRDLAGDPPPFALTVEWEANAELCSAPLVVNVANRAALPPAPDLVNLTLEEVLALLAAGSRFRFALQKLLSKKLGKRKGPAPDPVLDPHAKVDTSGFVLQRMRHAATALAGMRERLERPIAHREVLERRLRGPFSPLDLAAKLDAAVESGARNPREAAFLRAELALTLTRVDWQPIGDEIDLSACRETTRDLVDELAPADMPGDPQLAGYVRAAFAEAGA